MSTSTAPDFRPVVKDLPRVRVAAGVHLRLLVLAADEVHCAGIDLASGALVRAWCRQPAAEVARAFDVVQVTLDEDADAVPDPAQPEALSLAGPPEKVSRLTGRRCERMLKRLLHPKGKPLLGLSGTVVPFWERRPDHPSIALIEPEGQTLLLRDGLYLGCRFGWQGHQRELPCLDRAIATVMDRSGRTRMTAGSGDRLLVALTPPIDGRCHKVVEAVIPRP